MNKNLFSRFRAQRPDLLHLSDAQIQALWLASKKSGIPIQQVKERRATLRIIK